MTIDKKWLTKWQESMFTSLTESQENAILEMFGTEPFEECEDGKQRPQAWTEQDIAEGIRCYLNYGKWSR